MDNGDFWRAQRVFEEAIRHLLAEIHNQGCAWGKKELEQIHGEINLNDQAIGNFAKSLTTKIDNFEKDQNSKNKSLQSVANICVAKTKEYRDETIKIRDELNNKFDISVTAVERLKLTMMDERESAHISQKAAQKVAEDNAIFKMESIKEYSKFTKDIGDKWDRLWMQILASVVLGNILFIAAMLGLMKIFKFHL